MRDTAVMVKVGRRVEARVAVAVPPETEQDAEVTLINVAVVAKIVDILACRARSRALLAEKREQNAKIRLVYVAIAIGVTVAMWARAIVVRKQDAEILLINEAVAVQIARTRRRSHP